MPFSQAEMHWAWGVHTAANRSALCPSIELVAKAPNPHSQSRESLWLRGPRRTHIRRGHSIPY
jgi:hypothetical protein